MTEQEKEFCETMIGGIASVIDNWRDFNGIYFIRKGEAPVLTSFDLAKSIVQSSFFMQEIRRAVKQEREETEEKNREGYNSPITIAVREYVSAFNEAVESEIIRAVNKVAVYVDKEELAKALNYDRNQYNKGYDIGFWRGEQVAAKRFAAAIKERLRIPEKRSCNTATFSKGQIRAVVNDILEEITGEVNEND